MTLPIEDRQDTRGTNITRRIMVIIGHLQDVIMPLRNHSQEGGGCHVRTNEMGADDTLESMERT
jgi:hypothetical protein